MKIKEKRRAFSLKCPNCLIESGLADIYTNIPRPYRERARAGARTSGPQFFFQTRAPGPILKATAISSENVIAVLVLIQIQKKCSSVSVRGRACARGDLGATIFIQSFFFLLHFEEDGDSKRRSFSRNF